MPGIRMENTDFVIILGENPYQSGRAYSALTFCQVAQMKKMSVRLFLIDNGVFLAKNLQNPDNFRSGEEWVRAFIEEGGIVEVCETSLKERGVDKSELMEGVKVSNMPDLVRAAKDAGQTIFF